MEIVAEPSEPPSTTPLKRIGYGSCGSVWASPSANIDSRALAAVLKRGDGLPERSLAHEAQMHRHILATLTSTTLTSPTTSLFNIPQHIAFLQPSSPSPSWPHILPRLPHGPAPCDALVSERIIFMSLPHCDCTRRFLATTFWRGPRGLVDAVVGAKANEHCLVRPSLGRRRHHQERSRPPPISLRNFPLHADQMEALGLPTQAYEAAMADALAFLPAYVLARPRSHSSPAHAQVFTGAEDTALVGAHALWVLDFDCCGPRRSASGGMILSTRARTGGATRTGALKTQAVRKLPEQLVARIVETVGGYAKGVPVPR
ncbi:hypothetical protein B0T24DRAFT_677747 [Lasiosphaeria ovina]|uniref:DUF3669 domain-containing protein n=1 Tax=Lasiosphaeria ovina TaxID=92902 RepID=A0AAE0NB78_9PEZI|nr:hypothetical protein B0T24DRAFT_677747 [Lasiosphaeria ovina]